MRPARLLPQGTVAEAFLAARGRRPMSKPSNPRLPEGLAVGVAGLYLDEGLLYEVWEILRCAPRLDPEGQSAMAYLIAACLASARQGSTRLPVAPRELDPVLAALKAGRGERIWLRSLLSGKRAQREAAGSILGEGDDFKPLILEGGYLYLHRLRACEQRLSERLRARMEARPPPPDGLASALAAVLERPARLAGRELRLSGEQERAVLAAFHSALAVITGGPGTGKTSIIVSLLRTLVRLGVPQESIALAAPTGKAANRMEQSIRAALSSIEPCDEPDRLLLERGPVPKTLHRLLGYSPRADRFRHHENNPLSEQVVIVDECSMVDLYLMDRLVSAVDPERARLVLLGDSEQLPSVEAGAVFRDLVPLQGPSGPKPWDRLVRSELPAAGPAADAADPRGMGAVRLTRSYRQDGEGPEGRQIIEAAALVNQGRAVDLLSLVARREDAAEVQFKGVELLAAETTEAREAMLERWFQARISGLPGLHSLIDQTWRLREGQVAPEQFEQLETLTAHFERSRILCVTRGESRPTGAAAVNASVRGRWLSARGVPDGAWGPRWLHGEPVMAERNDYVRGLFNGDQGLVLQVAEGAGPAGTRALFSRRASWSALIPDGEAGLSTCYAMTVHKAQGSELDAVLLVLPDEDIPALTREILYTAITRARRSVVILGAPDVLAAGVARMNDFRRICIQKSQSCDRFIEIVCNHSY